MNVLAINGSPRAKKGATDLLLRHFLAGAVEAGAEAETIYVAKHKINYCTGCFGCWTVHPGQCIHKDDMPELLKKRHTADMVVYATPVYVDGMTAQLKTFMDRCITGALPFVEVRDGHHRHPGRTGQRKRKRHVLISTCGFGEVDNFDSLVHHVKSISRNMNAKFLGSLLRPMSPVLEFMQTKVPEKLDAIYGAYRKAGYDAVTRDLIEEETIRQACEPFMTMEHFMRMANKFFHKEIAANEEKRRKKAEAKADG
jgi:multimeric flavodoxin WrbA